MAYKFNDEDKTAPERTDYLPFGVNTVEIVGATAGETDAGKDYIEVTVKLGDIEDNARLWFTGGASKYSFQTLQQIVVHSAKTDADKEKARMAAEKCVDTDDMANLLNSKCVGAECWVTKYYDPTRTYSNANGDLKKSINTNLYGYKPNEKPELMPAPADEIIPVEGNITDDGKINIPGQWN
jgi:hypothetical protein